MILFQLRLNLYEVALMGAALGLLFGLIPLILGFIKKERSYGVFGFLGSIIGGSILGVFLSIPIVAIFTWLILRKPKSKDISNTETSTRICPQCHTQYTDDVIFCLQDGTVLKDQNSASLVPETTEETLILPADAIAPTQASFNKSEKP